MQQLNENHLNILADALQARYGFATKRELDLAVSDVLRRGADRATRPAAIQTSKLIRGLRIIAGGAPLNPQTAEADVQYVRALSTGETPGSYLVPTIQAEEIIEYLNLGGVARAAGARVWQMQKVQKLNVPVSLGTPTWEWLGQNTAQTASDPNLGQMAFDLKERRCLIAIPNQLIVVSVPAFDSLLAELIGLGAAEHEDAAFFASSSVSGGPKALMDGANAISTLLVGGSANGGNIGYADLLAVLAKSAAVKAKGPFAWFASPRTYYSRILGLVDSNSRPLAVPTAFSGLTVPQFQGAVVAPAGVLFGYPVYVTPAIAENEANGSGTNQSHLIFTNPKYCHIAQDGNIEMAVSVERYFEANQTAVRAVQHEDFGCAPAAGVVVLEGIN